jgi:hypothetical protein
MLLDQRKYLYLDTGKLFSWIDEVRENDFMTNRCWLGTCKEINVRLYTFRQNQSLLSSRVPRVHENCMVKFLQLRTRVLRSCEKIIVKF